jgi:glycosyltransferase involved in cell wall biosynthesis
MDSVTGGKRFNLDISSPKPLISIITVCLNADKNIATCIDSVIAYGNNKCEHIIIDGASTDKTVDILKEFNNKIEFWISEKDQGIYNAMNKAIKYVKGKWVLFLGSDDQLHSEFPKIIPYLKEDNTVYYGDYLSDEKKYGGKFSTYRLTKSNFCQQCVLYSANIFQKYSFNERYKISADHLFNIQCWVDRSYNFEYLPIVLTIFSSSGISSNQKDSILVNDLDGIILQHFGIFFLMRYKIKKIKLSIYKTICKNT